MDEGFSRPATLEDLKKVIQSLTAHHVDYLLIGGYALAAHGLIRATTEIDLLVRATKEDGEKIIKAMLILPDQSAKNIDLAWFQERDTIRLADEVVVDIMFNAAGHTYDDLKGHMEIIDLDGLPIRTLNLEGLLLTKQTLRDKDAPDRAALLKALEFLRSARQKHEKD